MQNRYKILSANSWNHLDYTFTTIQQDQMENIRQWRNAQISILRQQHPITEEEQQLYYKKVIIPSFVEDSPHQILFAMFKNNKLVGYGGLTHINWTAKNAEISFLTNPDRLQDKQLSEQDAYAFLSFLIKIAFEELLFHRLYAEVYASRKELIPLLEKLQFHYEGCFREHQFKAGQWLDAYLYGLLNDQKQQKNHITIANRKIGPAHPPFIVAEISANHYHSLDHTLQLVHAAKQAGADAIKLQTFTPDTMTLEGTQAPFTIKDPESLWEGKTLYQLYQEAAMPWEWHHPIFELCKKLKIIAFSTPFDATAVEYLESLNVPCYKIASLEIVDLPLIRKVAATGKPLIISTGAATLEEIEEAVFTAQQAGCKELILLKCTTAYPATAEMMHLNTIREMQRHFQLPIGLSDHTLGVTVPVASVALGACLIEKHFTLSRSIPTLDAAFSLEPAELKQLATEAKAAWLALGTVTYGPSQAELPMHRLRRSLHFTKNLSSGDILSEDCIKAIRPGDGLPPKELAGLIGKTLKKDVKRGDPVVWNVIGDVHGN